MGRTVTEKILDKAAGERVVAGETYLVDVDFMFGNDITVPIAINEFEKAGFKKVCNPRKIAFFNDHFTPNKDIASAEQAKQCREFAKRHGIRCFDTGRVGIEHAYIPERGMVKPGQVVIGADSHSCTHGYPRAFATGVGSSDLAGAMAMGRFLTFAPYQHRFIINGKPQEHVYGKDLILYTLGDISVKGALLGTMEFEGGAFEYVPMDSRLSMSNMVTEGGAINCILPMDDIAREFLKETGVRWEDEFDDLFSDPDAHYERTRSYDASRIEPQVAYPFKPDNTRPISEAVKDNIKVDQVVIGSCTNGRWEDIKAAVDILRGRKAHPETRVIFIPATQALYRRMAEEGYIQDLIDAECAVSTPTCGPCLGGHMGVLAKGERAIATTNRNFVTRMGHENSEVYLSNAAIAAASAVLGRIGHPGELKEYR